MNLTCLNVFKVRYSNSGRYILEEGTCQEVVRMRVATGGSARGWAPDKIYLNLRAVSRLHMSAALRRPTERTCERCGRAEQWNPSTESWELADDDPGSVYCIHEWDINGRFMPFNE